MKVHRVRSVIVASVAAVSLLGLSPIAAEAGGTSNQTSSRSAEQQLAASCFSLANAHRTRAGKPKVKVHPLVAKAALSHSKYQAAKNRMTHSGAGGSTPGDRLRAVGYRSSTWGENVAAGYPDCAAVMKGWMNSKGHRNNILDRSFTHIGIASARSKSGTLYWTMVLAAPR